MKFEGVILFRVAWLTTLAMALWCGTAAAAETQLSESPGVDAEPLSDGGDQASTAKEPPEWSDPLEKFLRQRIGPPLKALHRPVDKWLGGLPMWVAVAAALGLYGIAVIWVWTLSSEFVFRGAPDHHRWRDLRIWATVVVMPYVALYLWLGR